MTLSLDKSTWKRVAFGDVVCNVNETVRDLEAAGIDRIIAMEHMDPGELKISRWGSAATGTTFTRRVKPGQTLFGKRRAYQRKVAYADFDAICSGDIYTFEADETCLLGQFLAFLVQSEEFFEHALGTSAGSLSPRTNWRDLANFGFDLPPLDEQKRIANLLWAIELHRRSLRLADQVLELDESANGLGRAVFEKLASKWPTARFGDALKVSSGTFLPAKDMIPGNIPVYGGNGISGFHLIANCADPAVVIGRVGAYCGVVHETDMPSWVTDNALLVKRAEGFDREFLASTLRHARLNQYASQTAQPAVSGRGLAEAKLSRPGLDSQRDYMTIRRRILASQESFKREATHLDRLLASISVEVFGGK